MRNFIGDGTVFKQKFLVHIYDSQSVSLTIKSGY